MPGRLELIKNALLSCGELTTKRKRFLLALSATSGNVLQASNITGMTRNVHVHGMKTEVYRQFYEDIMEDTLDWWEGQLKKLGEKEDFQAIKFYLQSKGKKRGYDNENQINLNVGNIIRITYEDPTAPVQPFIEVEEIDLAQEGEQLIINAEE